MTLVAVEHLRTNALVTPLSLLGGASPRFSWRLTTTAAEVLQTAYEVEVALAPFATVPSGSVWSSGRVESDLPYGATYAGPSLASRTRYHWRVRVWVTVAGKATESDWSEPSWFETGQLHADDWGAARWIGGPPPASKAADPGLYLRGAVTVRSDVVRARAYVSSLGWHRFFVNGIDLTGDAHVPRFTPYSEVVEYVAYDVTDALKMGDNLVGIVVADGRYRGSLGMGRGRESYGKDIGAMAHLVIDLADGTTITADTTTTWSAGPGRIQGADPMNGERIDLRLSDEDWLSDPVPPARFAPARLLPTQAHPLVAEEVARVTAVEHLRGTITRSPSGAQIVDFGQNFTGVVRIRVSGPPGTTVRLTHAEVLTPSGELDPTAFHSLKATWTQQDTITLAGRREWVQPWVTLHGFRYGEVVGLQHDLTADDVEGVVYTSDLTRVGTFASSDSRLDRLYRNVLWSVISNFTDTPTDCPTRERSGWTGDIQAFAPTAAVLVDAEAFLWRYLGNLALEQYPDGVVPIFIPSESPLKPSFGRRIQKVLSGSVGWSDAAVLLPWSVYLSYGDKAILERQYDSMKLRVDGLAQRARTKGRGGPYLVDTGFHFGEWLRPGENGLTSIKDHVLRSPAEIATAYLAQIADVMSKTATVLGRNADSRTYRELSNRVAEAWRRAFVHPDGTIAKDRQDDYVRALAFNLLLPSQRPGAVSRLVELIEAADDHLTTGFLSTPMILQVLTEGGRADVALRLLFQTSNPSWLNQVAQGATTVWETWEGFDEAGNGKESHNHYALGAVASWLVNGLAGLSASSPGYRNIRVDPVLTDQLDHVEASVVTPYGTLSSGWRRVDDHVVVSVTVPPGTQADVVTRDRSIISVGSGAHTFTFPSPTHRPPSEESR